MSLAIKTRRIAQRGLLQVGLWATPLDAYRRRIAQMYYRSGGFSFIQIGANDGISFDDFFWTVLRFNCRGLAIEPMRDAFERLQHNYRPYPRVTPIRCAVHPTEPTVTIHRLKPHAYADAPATAYGSASLDTSWLHAQGVEADQLEPERVPARPLMHIVEEHGMHTPDVLQIDTEGFDDQVIGMIDFDRFRPRLIKYEAIEFRGNGDAARLDDARRRLEDHGYRVRRLSHMDMLALDRKPRPAQANP